MKEREKDREEIKRTVIVCEREQVECQGERKRQS